MRTYWRGALRLSTNFFVTRRLSASAEIALYWVDKSRKMNWKPVENFSCETPWISKDFWLLVVDISVAFMNAGTNEEIYVKVPWGIKSSRFWRLKAAVNGTRKASKHWHEFSCDKLVTNMFFQQNDINPCIYKRFCDNLDLEQHGDDFHLCGATQGLEELAKEFNGHFLVKKSGIASLKPEH